MWLMKCDWLNVTDQMWLTKCDWENVTWQMWLEQMWQSVAYDSIVNSIADTVLNSVPHSVLNSVPHWNLELKLGI